MGKAERDKIEALKEEKRVAALRRKADKETEIKAKKEAKAAAAAAKEAEIQKRLRMRKGTMIESDEAKAKLQLQFTLLRAAVEQLREAINENDIFAIQSAITAANDVKLGENEEYEKELAA